MDAGSARVDEIVATSDLDDAATLQSDNHSAIARSTSFSPEIPKSDNRITLGGERQLHSSLPGDSIPSPSDKRSRSMSGSERVDGRANGWVYDVFAENDSGTKGDGSPSSKRAQSSSCPLEAADQPPRCDQGCKVHQVVGESVLEYEVTAFTKLWLPKASVDPKLVRNYQAEQRAATRVRTCVSRAVLMMATALRPRKSRHQVPDSAQTSDQASKMTFICS